MKKVFLSLAPLLMFATTINFDTALRETYHNNNELKAKKLNIKMAKTDLSKVKSYDWGNFWLEEDISKSKSNFGGLLPSSEERKNYRTRAVYEFPIFTGYKIKYAKEISRLQIKANKFKYGRDKNKLAIEVLKAYNGVVAAKYFIKALQSAKKTTTSFINMTNELYSQGMVVKSDVLSAEARDSEVDAKMIEAKNKYNLALSYLRFLTGNRRITDVKDFRVIISPYSNLKKLQQIALENRNDIKWMQENVKTMQKKVKMDKSIYYPTLGTHLEYGYDGEELKLDNDHNYWVVDLNIKYNLLEIGAKQELEKSKIQSQQIAYYYAHMRNGIKVDVEQKFLNLQAKTSMISVKVKNRDLAHAVLSQYKEMYKNGLVNIAILLMKQADVQKADAELIKAKYDQAIAAAELKLAIGSEIKENK